MGPPNIGVQAIIAALEAIGDEARCVSLDVQIVMPYPSPAESWLKEPEVEVGVRFIVPAKVAARHGFAERRGIEA